MPSYLHRRGAVYYTRLAVPERLRPVLGQRDLGRSTGEKDLKAAKKHIPGWLAEAQARIAWAEEQLAEQAAEDQDARREARRKLKEHYEDRLRGSTAEMPPELAAFHDILREQREEYGVRLMMRRAERFALAKEALEPSKSSTTIRQLFNAYAAQEGMNPSTMGQYRSIIENLIEFAGHNEASGITHADIIRWLEHLRTQPIERGRAAGKLRSARTINDSYLAAVKAVFGYGKQALLIDANPASEVRPIKAAKPAKLREKDFTKEERRAILKGAREPVRGRVSEKRKLARRWVPWLCAYTGARVNEITQLRREDVAEIEGVWTIRITPEAGSQKTNTARTVPLHEHLIDEGFIAAIKGKPEGPLFYEPEQRRGGRIRPQSVKVGQWLAKWVREGLGIKDPAVQPNHGWRHTFKTVCREIGINEWASDAITGHVATGQGRKYGSNPVGALAGQLAKFPRYDLNG